MLCCIGTLLTGTITIVVTSGIVCYFRNRLRIKSNTTEARDYLRNKVVLVTGASSGLGEHIAKEFYRHGCKLILASRRIDELNRVKSDLMKLSVSTSEPKVVSLDLTDPKLIEEVVQKQILPIYGYVDVLVNNAGLSSRSTAMETSFDVDQQLINVNFLSQISLTKAILRPWIEKRPSPFCHVVVVSSIQGRVAIPKRSSYSFSKHALQAFFDSLRAELTGSKIPINISVISPGYIATNLSLNALKSDGTKYGLMDQATANGYTPDFVAERILEMVLNRDKEVILSPLVPKLLIIIRAVCPKLYFFLMSLYAQKR